MKMQQKHRIGMGIFGWEGTERRTSRYGSFVLLDQDYNQTVTVDTSEDQAVLKALKGKRVKITCVVKESRKSGHVGDVFLRVFPSQPDVGEEIVLGVGTLATSPSFDPLRTQIGLRPSDRRSELWMDPRKLYRLHDQTVEVFIEETREPEHVVEPFSGQNESGTQDLGDGTFQMKKVPDASKVRVPPTVEHVSDGLFVLDWAPKAGRRF